MIKGLYKTLWNQFRAVVTYSPKKRYTQKELLELLDYMEKGKVGKDD